MAPLVEPPTPSTADAAPPGSDAVELKMDAVSAAVTMPATPAEVGSPMPMPMPMPMPPMPLPPLPLPIGRSVLAEPVSPWPKANPVDNGPALPLDMGLALSGLDDATRQLYERAYRLFLDSAAAGRPLTGGELGAACGRGERWGRNRIADVKSALQRQAARQPLTATAGR